MNHPFQIGAEYRNRNGRYHVLAIAEPKMRIRYEDGREDLVTIEIQARIWQAIQDEMQQENATAVRSSGVKKQRRPSLRRGYAFGGLQESDFKDNVAGTHWRSRDSLGGRLAQHLSDTTPYKFQSYSIYRRPSVYVYLPERYDPDNGIPYAKYELRLSPAGAQYGFYVERADRSMDSTWHWYRFIAALENDKSLQKKLLQAMQEYDLYWLLQLEEGEGKSYSFIDEIHITAASPLLWQRSEVIDWPEFIRRLQAVLSNQWLNVHLCGWTNKEKAVDAGERFAETVTQVFKAILPLYLVSVYE